MLLLLHPRSEVGYNRLITGADVLRYFANLQAMRGIAALMVLLIHALLMPGNFGLGVVASYARQYGAAGVDIFFVISGFIITVIATTAAQSDRPRGAIVSEFLVKRAVRIYPAYWAALIFALVMVNVAPVGSAHFPRLELWRLFLLLEHYNYLIYAAWTLTYEMYFYLVVAIILLIMPRRLHLGLAIWAVLTAAAVYYAGNYAPELLKVPMTSPLVFEFVMGAIVGLVIQRKITAFPIAAVAVGLAWFLIGAEFNRIYNPNWHHYPRTLFFGPGAAMIIYGVIAAEIRHGWVFSKPWQRLGDASYSLYIWHQPLYYAVFWVYRETGLLDTVPGWSLLVLMLAVLFAVSFTSYWFLERKAQKLLLGRLLPVRLPTPLVFAGTMAIAAVAFYPLTPFLSPTRTYTPAQVVGSGELTMAAQVKIANSEDSGKRQLLLEVSAPSPGSLFTGYLADGQTIEAIVPFPAGKSMVSIDLTQIVDGPHIWVQEMEPKVGAKLTSATILRDAPLLVTSANNQ